MIIHIHRYNFDQIFNISMAATIYALLSGGAAWAATCQPPGFANAINCDRECDGSVDCSTTMTTAACNGVADSDNVIRCVKCIATNSNITIKGTNNGAGSYDVVCRKDNGTYSGNYTINTLGGDDIIDAGSGNDAIDTSTGDDIIYSNGGDDSIDSGAGTNIVYCGDGNDTFTGTSAGVDTVYGEGGSDNLTGSSGTSSLYGGDGDDTITLGAAGNAYGNAGNDVIHGSSGGDVINGGSGDDLLFGNAGADSLYGDGGFDELYGGDGNDLLRGSGAGSRLFGGGGNDSLLNGGTSWLSIILAGWPHDYFASTLCGGHGDDNVFSIGPYSDVCIDGGSGTDVCEYHRGDYYFNDRDDHDLGTKRRCESDGDSLTVAESTTTRLCGCGD